MVLVHCITINNYYQDNSRILNTFFPNKAFRQLFSFSPENVTFPEFSYIEVWFTDKSS